MEVLVVLVEVLVDDVGVLLDFFAELVLPANILVVLYTYYRVTYCQKILIQCIIDLPHMGIRIKRREKWQRFTLDYLEIFCFVIVRLVSPPLFHGVDELCGFGIAKIDQLCYVESGHHVVVFMY